MTTEPQHDAVAQGAHAKQDKIWAHFQNAGVESFSASRPRLNFLVRQVARRAGRPKPEVLNIGVGNGHFELTAHDRGWHVKALDPDAAAIARLTASGIEGHVGYIDALPFADASFDFVVASEVLEHLTDMQRTAGLREIRRVLKPGGWFLGTVPYNEDLRLNEVVCPTCGDVFHRWGHQKSFNLEAVRKELAPLFEVREMRRTAFVSFRERGLGGKCKSLARLILAKAGQMIAIPSIYWAARRI